MIIVKSEREIELMRRAGKITAAARALAGEMVKPGVTTREIDKAVFHFIRSQGAEPSFLNYNGYPASVCVSVNDEIIHGIPGPRVLKEGDIVSVDVGAYIGGFHGDCAATYPCGKISEEAQRLIDVTRQSFFEGFAQAREGNRISDISHAVQACVEANGFSVVREYVGHGVGRNMHEAPEIPNYGAPGHGPKLLRGMTIAVEPMVNAGTAAIRQMSDGWTVKTRDGKYAAHYENTILITAGEPEILTAPAPLFGGYYDDLLDCDQYLYSFDFSEVDRIYLCVSHNVNMVYYVSPTYEPYTVTRTDRIQCMGKSLKRIVLEGKIKHVWLEDVGSLNLLLYLEGSGYHWDASEYKLLRCYVGDEVIYDSTDFPDGIEGIGASVPTYSIADGKLMVHNASGYRLSFYNLSGVEVYSQILSETTETVPLPAFSTTILIGKLQKGDAVISFKIGEIGK